MATIDQYKIVVDVQGEQAVERLKNSIGGLGSLIAGIGFGAFVAGAFRMADAINDVADATGLAAGEVEALALSLEQAGGQYDDVGKIVTKFYKSLEEGASDSGSKSAEALAKVGIGLNELRTLSEGQLLSKALGELAEMEKGAARTALGMELFGKSFASIDPKILEEALRTKDVTKLNEEIQKAAAFVGAMEANFRTLQRAALSALTPITGEIENFRLSAEQAEKIIKVVGGTLALMFGAKLITGIVGAVQAILFLNKALVGTAIVGQLLGKNPLFKIIGGLAVAAGIGAAAWENLSGEISSVNKEADELLGKASKFGDLSVGQGGAFKGATGVTKQQADNRAKEALAAKQVTEQMIRQNDEANKLRQKSIDLIGVEADRANLIKSNAQAEADSRNKIADLDAKIVAERAKGKDANAAVVVELQRQKDVISGQLEETLKLNQAEYQRLQLQKQIKSDIEFSLANLELLVDTEKDLNEFRIRSLVIQGKLSEEQAKRRLDLDNLRFESEKKIALLDAQIADAKEAKDNAEVYRLETLQGIEMQRFTDAKSRMQELTSLQDKLNQSASAGAVAAMNSIAKQFEPYKMAQDAIMMGWNKIGSAVDDFVETGKFKFSDFARSVVQDLAKMIIKAQIFKAIQATLGFFGIPIPGMAAGGPVAGNQPYIVGEKGPELFVPKSAGTVIPNNKLPNKAQATGTGMVNAPITNNYITNNIQAVDAKSVAQLFAENRRTLLGSVEMARRELPYQMA